MMRSESVRGNSSQGNVAGKGGILPIHPLPPIAATVPSEDTL